MDFNKPKNTGLTMGNIKKSNNTGLTMGSINKSKSSGMSMSINKHNSPDKTPNGM